jgi:hypothetical protein
MGKKTDKGANDLNRRSILLAGATLAGASAIGGSAPDDKAAAQSPG